jgi:hypothetical protein
MNASQAELHHFVMNSLDGVHPDFAEPFQATKIEGMLHPPIRMRDMMPVEFPKGRVTLLGDAIHPMGKFPVPDPYLNTTTSCDIHLRHMDYMLTRG